MVGLGRDPRKGKDELLVSFLPSSLQGGLDDEVKHSAYITSALLEISLPVTVRICLLPSAASQEQSPAQAGKTTHKTKVTSPGAILNLLLLDLASLNQKICFQKLPQRWIELIVFLFQQSLVRNALFCLEREAQTDEVDIYTQALLAYVFTLAEKEDKRKEMLQLLEANAVKEEDGSIHWQQPREQEKKAFSPLNNHQTRSVDIVMTSYVLLAHVEKKPAPSPEEMSISSRIAKWLTGQQNPTGGFLSTQDTVVALQALSKYSTLDYSQSRAVSKVSLSSGADFQKEFHVDSTNSLLLQSQALPKVPGNYQAEVTGGRSVLLQTTLKYNVHPDQEEPPFKLDLHTVPEACMDPKAQTKFALALNLSYTGQRANSNMVIVDVKMLSGFIPVKSSVQKVTVLSVHQRTEVSTDRVLLYLEEVTSVTQHYSFMVEQEVPVQGLKPAFVTVYDYYEPDEKAVAAYSAPCSTGTV
uniref:Alpha-macroglobulin receptor-binding domain-containing protein n=1 Tax=Varanus komodoensis TaxID=61221 RepID=A0A8D2L781_VARKO